MKSMKSSVLISLVVVLGVFASVHALDVKCYAQIEKQTFDLSSHFVNGVAAFSEPGIGTIEFNGYAGKDSISYSSEITNYAGQPLTLTFVITQPVNLPITLYNVNTRIEGASFLDNAMNGISLLPTLDSGKIQQSYVVIETETRRLYADVGDPFVRGAGTMNYTYGPYTTSGIQLRPTSIPLTEIKLVVSYTLSHWDTILLSGNLQLSPAEEPLFYGKVKLGGWIGTVNPIGKIPVVVSFDNGSNQTVNLNGTNDVGSFVVRAGTHDSVRVKPYGFLAQRLYTPAFMVDFMGPDLVNGLVAGDLNNDNKIDDFDLAGVIFNFGQTVPSADVNGDGIVDDFDLALVIFNFGKVGDD